jgi:hypothetical protein
MPVEPRENTGTVPKENLGSLRGCLVDGDAEQRGHERRIRRRALAISIILQSGVLAVLVLFPLFGKTERLAVGKDYIPIPPYGRTSSHPTGDRKPTNSRPTNSGSHFTFNSLANKPHLRPTGDSSPVSSTDFDPLGNQPNEGQTCSWCVDIGGKNNGPRPPQPIVEPPLKPRVVKMTTIDPAMLIRRIEPVYPLLAKQTHREGRVEMRARIATDGTIQSLEVVSGDPLFYQSAKDAVGQWLYRATVLNGQKVEIDTYITVIYTMQH